MTDTAAPRPPTPVDPAAGRPAGDGVSSPPWAAVAAFDLLLTAGGYWALARMTLALASPQLPVPLWAAVGWSLGLMLLRPYQRWPAVIIGTAAGELINDVLLGFASWEVVPATLANMVEMTVAAALFIRFVRGPRQLDTRRGLAAFVAAIAIAGAVGATLGSLIDADSGYLTQWWQWWRGDTLGYLVLTPLVLAAGRWWRDGRSIAKWPEGLVAALLVVAGCALVVSNDLPIEYLLLPLLTLCAYRFGVLGASASTAAVVVATFAATAQGNGPLAAGGFNHKTVAQLFFVGAAVSNLLLAAEVGQSRRAELARNSSAQRLLQRQRRFQAMVEHSADVSMILSPAGAVQYASPNLQGLLGMPAHLPVDLPPIEWVHEEDRSEVVDHLTQVRLGPPGATATTEMRVRRDDGATVWVEAVASNWIAEPLVDGIVINLRDITARRRSEDLNRALVDGMLEGVIICDRTGIIQRADGLVEQLLGRSAAEMVGLHFARLMDPEHRDALTRRLEEAAAALIGSGRPHHVRQAAPYDHPDGTRRWFESSSGALREPDGSIGGYAVMLTDVTEAHEAERARRRAEARYRSIVESSFEGIVVSDGEGVITYANSRALALCGCRSEHDLIGHPVASLFAAEDGAALQAASVRIDRGDDVDSWPRLSLRRGDGSTRWVRWTVTRMAPEAGYAPGAATHVFLDITGQVELEERRGTIAAELALAAETERKRLAEDLHDGPIQRLSATALRLSTAALIHAARPEVAEPLSEAGEEVRTTATDLRAMLFELAPPDLTDSGLAMAILRAGEAMLGADDVAVQVHAELDHEPAPAVALAAYRIAQEALTNIRTHAHATEVVIDLCSQAGGLRLELADNGIGCDPARLARPRPGHLGVRSMRERAIDLGGWCRIDSSAPALDDHVASGTTVTVWLPDLAMAAAPS